MTTLTLSPRNPVFDASLDASIFERKFYEFLSRNRKKYPGALWESEIGIGDDGLTAVTFIFNRDGTWGSQHSDKFNIEATQAAFDAFCAERKADGKPQLTCPFVFGYK